MKPNCIPVLNNWVLYSDGLIGEALNHPGFENGQRVMTNTCTTLDEKMGLAICTENEIWQLGPPGKLSRYVDPVTKRFF